MPLARIVAVCSALALVVLSGGAFAHTVGSCAPTPLERCESWSQVADDETIVAPARSDQFGVEVLTTASLTIVAAKDVSFDTSDPYASRAVALVRAYAVADGREVWTARYADRSYVNLTAATLSPDGSTVYLAGGAYDGFPVGATDSQLFAAALSAEDGSLRWASHWDARPDAVDNGKAVEVAPDGSEVYVAGVTTSAAGDLDYVTTAFDAQDGRLLWASTYAGPRDRGSDAVYALAVSPARDLLYVTGASDGIVDYDADYATVAYNLGHAADEPVGDSDRPGRGLGRDKPKKHDEPAPTSGPVAGSVAWVARYDGLGQHKSERGYALAVSPDGSRVFVTGDSYAGKGGGDYDYATVAYDASTGGQLWQARYSGVRGGFNSAGHAVAGAGVVVVAGQSAGQQNEGNDAVAVGYDAATGAQRWVAAIAPARSDDYARALALSSDGSVTYLLSSDIPIINYTAVTRTTLTALDARTGVSRWQSTLDGGSVNALGGTDLAVSGDGTGLAVLADLKRSADPLGSQSQNIYDVVTARFAG